MARSHREIQAGAIQALDKSKLSNLGNLWPEVMQYMEPFDPGEKYTVPKKLKDAFLRQQDYTQKTMSVAERGKAIEAREAELSQRAQAQQQHIAEYAEAYGLDAQLKAGTDRMAQYAKLDWDGLAATDPVQHGNLLRLMILERQQLEDVRMKRDGIISSVTQKQQAQRQQMEHENVNRIAEGRAVLAREIQGWSPALAKELSTFGQTFGYKAEELTNISDPRAVKLLHKAYLFDQLMKKQSTPKEKPAPQEKPAIRIAAKAGTAAKDPTAMNDKEFAAWRRQAIAAR